MKALLVVAVWLHLCLLDLSQAIVTESVYLEDVSAEWNSTSVSEGEDLKYNATSTVVPTSTSVLEHFTTKEPTPKPSNRKPKSDKVLNTGITILPNGPDIQGTYMELRYHVFECYSNSNEHVKWKIISEKEMDFVSTKVNERFPNTCTLVFNRAKLALLKEAKFALRCISKDQSKDLTITVLPSSSVACNDTRDCVMNFDSDSICFKYGKYCVCPDLGTKLICPTTNNARPKETSVFKAAMVTVACFTAVVISVFVLFFVNRARICRALISRPERNDDDTHRAGGDVFTVSDRLARQRLADKPPTYQDVVCSDRLNRGTPPPAYSEEQEEIGTSTSRSSRGNSRFERRRNAIRLPRETADQLRCGRNNTAQQNSNSRPVTVTVQEEQRIIPSAPPSGLINDAFDSDA